MTKSLCAVCANNTPRCCVSCKRNMFGVDKGVISATAKVTGQKALKVDDYFKDRRK